MAIVVSFAYVIYIIEEPGSDNKGIGQTSASHIDMLSFYISHHPTFYALQMAGHKAGVVKKDALIDGLLDLVKANGDNAPQVFIHPLYVELQRQSPMCTLCNLPKYNVTEIDAEKQVLGKHEFYQKYLSKSLPVVLRNGAKEWGLVKAVQDKLKTSGTTGLEDYIGTLFAQDMGSGIKLMTPLHWTNLGISLNN